MMNIFSVFPYKLFSRFDSNNDNNNNNNDLLTNPLGGSSLLSYITTITKKNKLNLVIYKLYNRSRIDIIQKL